MSECIVPEHSVVLFCFTCMSAHFSIQKDQYIRAFICFNRPSTLQFTSILSHLYPFSANRRCLASFSRSHVLTIRPFFISFQIHVS